MTKHQITKPDKDFELEMQAEKSEHKLPHSIEEIDKTNVYLLAFAYASPFMPMIDLSFVFDELKKMLQQWLLKKKKDTIIDKEKADATI